MDDDFYNALFERIIHVDPNILREIELHGNRFNNTKAIIQVKEQELMKHKRAMEKLHESYEEDIIIKQVYVERKEVRSKMIQKLEEELRDLRKVVTDESEFPTVDDIHQRIGKFKGKWSSVATPEDQNKALKTLVDRIIYNREDNRIELTVCYK
ncbi:hypothetical protein [Brevibacillus reuszeri]|uniref:hypothetical protein n=1 Tax=Brevibacillus reuszeri TaxID=54915 RepID=UPI0013E0D46B|nr:hypothetical protein [Brevibacillus reuszeri]